VLARKTTVHWESLDISLGSGRFLLLDSPVNVRKIDKHHVDPLDDWSHGRAAYLAWLAGQQPENAQQPTLPTMTTHRPTPWRTSQNLRQDTPAFAEFFKLRMCGSSLVTEGPQRLVVAKWAYRKVATEATPQHRTVQTRGKPRCSGRGTYDGMALHCRSHRKEQRQNPR
jgi:hypothetical protein